MTDYQYPPNDTEPSPRRNRAALRNFLMVLIVGLILLLILSLLSTLVDPAAPQAKAPPSQAVIEVTQTPEAPQPAVVLGENMSGNNSNPEVVSETGNQFISSSVNTSGLFGQLSQEALSNFQTCADELEYTARIDDTWDIWDLIFFTIYSNQSNTSTTPPACQQLASEFASNGQAEFISALGADWWTGDTLASLDTDPCSTAEECSLRQEAEQLLKNEGQKSFVACSNGLIPPALCGIDATDPAQACIEDYDWTTSQDELQNVVAEDYTKSFGDIAPACVLFVGLPFVSTAGIQLSRSGIQNGIRCFAEKLGCQAISPPNPDLSEAQACAADIQWSEPITDEAASLELVKYLAGAAPWLPPGSLQSSCTQLLISASPTEAGKAYWEFLGKTLSERRIDPGP